MENATDRSEGDAAPPRYEDLNSSLLARGQKAADRGASYCFEEGNLLFRSRDWHGASLEYEKSQRLQPGFIEAELNIAQVCSALGEWQKAVDRGLLILARMPAFHEVYMLIGGALRRMGKLDDAAGSYVTLLDLDRSFSQAHLALAELHFSRNPRNLARVEAELDACLAGSSRSPAALLSRAEVRSLKMRHLEACDEYRAALEVRPSCRDAQLGLAASLLEAAKVDEALAEARAVQRAFSTVPLPQAVLPDELSIPPMLLDQALARARQGLALFPDTWEPYLLMGFVLEQKKHYEEALAFFEDAQRHWGVNPRLHLKAARLNQRLGRVREAVHHYRAWVDHESGDSEALLMLGKCLVRLGELAEAAEVLERALLLEPGNVDIPLLLGGICEKLDDLVRAEEHYLSVLAGDSDNRRAQASLNGVRKKRGWKAYFARGLDLFGRGCIDEAADEWRVGLTVENAAPLHLYLAVASFSKGEIARAIDEVCSASSLEWGEAPAARDISARVEAVRSLMRAASAGDGQQCYTDEVRREVGSILYRMSALVDEENLVPGAPGSIGDGLLAERLHMAKEPAAPVGAAEEEAQDVLFVLVEEPSAAESPQGEAALAAGDGGETEEARLKAFGEWLERELRLKAQAASIVLLEDAEEEKVSDLALRKRWDRAPLHTIADGELLEPAPARSSEERSPVRGRPDWNQGLFWALTAGWYVALLLAELCRLPAFPALLMGLLVTFAAGAAASTYAGIDEWFDWKAGLVCGAVIGPTYIWWVMDFSSWNPVVALGTSIFAAFLFGGVVRMLVWPPGLQREVMFQTE